MKNKIILVGGYCAAGKSTFANNLSQKLTIPCFNKDTIKETLGDGFGPESGEVFEKGSNVTFMLMKYITKQFLQVSKVCILESNFDMWEIEELKKLLKKYDGECLLYVFKSDLDVVFDRYIARHNAGERHWVHKSGGSDREGFKNVMRDWFGLDGAPIENIVTVDTTSFENVNYEDLFAVAERFIASI